MHVHRLLQCLLPGTQYVGYLCGWWHKFGLNKRSVCHCHLFFMILEEQPTYLPLGDIEALFRKTERLSEFVSQCFYRSLRKGQLIQVVRESMATGIWYPCLHNLNNWSDWKRFAALELLVAAVGIEWDVHVWTVHSFQTSRS